METRGAQQIEEKQTNRNAMSFFCEQKRTNFPKTQVGLFHPMTQTTRNSNT
jgi:hypothetical protein